MKQGPVQIAGGGVSGLTTAIVLARRGVEVDVFERRRASAVLHTTRWDAVENWTTREDLNEILKNWAIETTPFRPATSIEVRTFAGECHVLTHQRPLLYVVKRGSEPGALEEALTRQALGLGVRIRYGETVAREQADVWAVGAQRRGFFLDAAITFRTSSPNRVVALVDRRLTPNAFAYLIVVDGLGTLAVLLTRQFKQTRALLAETITAFQRMQPFDMRETRLRSGIGGALNALGAPPSGARAVGEAAGFLDYLWGFGIRHAMLSGALAARALLEETDYETLVAREVRPLVQTSLVNRRFYDYATNRGDRALIGFFCARQDLHGALHRFYRSRGIRSLLWPWVMRSLL